MTHTQRPSAQRQVSWIGAALLLGGGLFLGCQSSTLTAGKLYMKQQKYEQAIEQLWTRELVEEMARDWQACLDHARSRWGVGAGGVGYWGLSGGTMFGLPLVALEPRIRAAVMVIPERLVPGKTIARLFTLPNTGSRCCSITCNANVLRVIVSWSRRSIGWRWCRTGRPGPLKSFCFHAAM